VLRNKALIDPARLRLSGFARAAQAHNVSEEVALEQAMTNFLKAAVPARTRKRTAARR
jgi:hypothetical protein